MKYFFNENPDDGFQHMNYSVAVELMPGRSGYITKVGFSRKGPVFHDEHDGVRIFDGSGGFPKDITSWDDRHYRKLRTSFEYPEDEIREIVDVLVGHFENLNDASKTDKTFK